MANSEKLKTLIDKINWLYKSFEANDFKNISSLEKALIKEQILLFYDEIENLDSKVSNERFPSVTSEKVSPPKIEVIEAPIEKVEGLVKEEPVIEKIEETPVAETVIEKVELEPIAEKVVEPIIEEKVSEPEIIPAKIEEVKPPVVSKSEEEIKRESFEKTVEFQRQIAMPKRDMREIIDLNKSFIFKAELFNQNNDIYNQFINEVNSTRIEDEALSLVVNWTEKMNWNTEENKAYDLLLRAIEKRFLPLI